MLKIAKIHLGKLVLPFVFLTVKYQNSALLTSKFSLWLRFKQAYLTLSCLLIL
jgi:hypothetical protein